MTTETTITDDVDGSAQSAQGFHLLVMSPEVFSSQPLPSSGIVNIGRSRKSEVQIDDAVASREHARIHVGSDGGVPVLTIEDVGSQNGTRVRDTVIKPGEPAAILPGEPITIGSTVVMVLQNRAAAGLRRVWSHAYFETRVDDECARASKTRIPFALARIRFKSVAPWTKVMPALARELSAPNVFATYGPRDYEILFVDTKEGETESLVKGLVEAFGRDGLEAQWAVAWYPRDGRTYDALISAANTALKTPGARPATAEVPRPDATGMQRVRDMAKRVATAPINVLIVGEMGVGKDVLARMIHALSPRAAKPFVPLNCAGVPEQLMESELFGHERGAFTGATTAKIGLFESANGGTVFLDEIGEMPMSMQARLLRAIETRQIRPVGGLRDRPIDVRFISATNLDIEAAVKAEKFRGDLMFRLNTMTLPIPPLRERKNEIAGLVSTFLEQVSRDMARETPLTISAEAMQLFHDYDWPGNIRELKNVIERAVVLCDGSEVLPEHLPLEKMRPAQGLYVQLDKNGASAAADADSDVVVVNGKVLPTLTDPREIAERKRILDALETCAWNQTRASKLLGMPRRTFVSKLDHYGIPRPQKGHGGRNDDDEDDDRPRATPGKGVPIEHAPE
ncbi:MAG TPA: sigma 54-interacting transcriptional regulator [Polyangia bacterium]|nr:sigma 54-interacting transcriptional regulator [Polyangia bacterium]